MIRSGTKMSGYAANIQYVTYDRSTPNIELRNVMVRFMDRHPEHGQRVELRVFDWFEKDVDGDLKLVDLVVLYGPEVWMYDGMMRLRGFMQIVRSGGKRVVDPDHEGADAPMRMVTVLLRPEAALTDDGKWISDRKPKK